MNNQKLLTIKELAQVITENGYKIGVRNLFKKLHEWEMIWVTANNRKEPTRQSIKDGYLEKGKSEGMDTFGRGQTTVVVMATEKGQEYILDRLMKELD
ncbi:phage antirepressor KilAC domain-containing protein [Sporosarcina sp. FSL K6-6792]|uniref:phage antirepressor KilAC domain-containing protein n=1 Tax=Sporosarcina sp. FSL K6-6792 TaxID=2921559 RepID=UPI0030F9CA30